MPGTSVDLSVISTRDTSAFPNASKKTARGLLATMNTRLSELQKLLWADGTRSVLLVLQAMDTGGKDGTIRKVLTGVNPQGVDVHGFGVPTEEELGHDYLWRVHAHTPADGRIAVFNRSHYEDLLVVRVLGLAPESVWSRRYRHIRDFESMLVDEGTIIRKVMLHISKDEQRERLQARLDDPSKAYKFNVGDLDTRAQWGDYMAAYATALEETSTVDAPWFVVPADRKWYRNLVVSQILIDAIQGLGLSYPPPDEDLEGISID